MKRVSIRIDALVLIVVLFMVFFSFRDSEKIVRDTVVVRPHIVEGTHRDPTGAVSEGDDGSVILPHQTESHLEEFDFIAALKVVRQSYADGENRTEPIPLELQQVKELESIDREVDSLMQRLHDASGVPQWSYSHEKYISLRKYFAAKAMKHRFAALQLQNQTRCMEFMRIDQLPTDDVYRVPCVPWKTPNLVSVEWKKYGLYTTFEHVKPRPAPALKVAVEMSGHMRTYRRCYASTVQHLLATNQALLFAVTYPDVGDKRFGIRFQDRDLPASVDEIAVMYGPYLASLYVLDVPTITTTLNGLFPAWFHLKQWSWMIYQLFTMDIAHDIAMAHILNSNESETFHTGDPSYLKKIIQQSANRALWDQYDVMIRVRPDLYVLGPIWLQPLDPTRYLFNFSCGSNAYTIAFDKTEIIRAPHHPNYEWFLDKLSDHSAIGFAETMGPFMKLFSSVRRMTFSRQGDIVFKHGNTAERMWSQHAERINVKLTGGVGWHIMLRNGQKYKNSTHVIAKTLRRKIFTDKVFGVTDPSQVECPDPTGRRETMPPKPKPLKKQKRP